MTIFGIPFHAQTDERNEIGEAVQRNLRILQSHSRNPLKMYLARWWPGKDAIKTRCVCVCVCVHARARARVRVRGGHVCLCACVFERVRVHAYECLCCLYFFLWFFINFHFAKSELW